MLGCPVQVLVVPGQMDNQNFEHWIWGSDLDLTMGQVSQVDAVQPGA